MAGGRERGPGVGAVQGQFGDRTTHGQSYERSVRSPCVFKVGLYRVPLTKDRDEHRHTVCNVIRFLKPLTHLAPSTLAAVACADSKG